MAKIKFPVQHKLETLLVSMANGDGRIKGILESLKDSEIYEDSIKDFVKFRNKFYKSISIRRSSNSSTFKIVIEAIEVEKKYLVILTIIDNKIIRTKSYEWIKK